MSVMSGNHMSSISCDGGGGALGHPLIYLDFGQKDRVECPYCGAVFFNESHEQSAHPALQPTTHR